MSDETGSDTETDDTASGSSVNLRDDIAEPWRPPTPPWIHFMVGLGIALLICVGTFIGMLNNMFNMSFLGGLTLVIFIGLLVTRRFSTAAGMVVGLLFAYGGLLVICSGMPR